MQHDGLLLPLWGLDLGTVLLRYGRQVFARGGGEKRGEKKGGETNPKVAGNLEFLIFLDFFYINFA